MTMSSMIRIAVAKGFTGRSCRLSVNFRNYGYSSSLLWTSKSKSKVAWNAHHHHKAWTRRYLASSTENQNNNSSSLLYEDHYRESVEDTEGFWSKAAKNVHWFREPTKILETTTTKITSSSSYRWFPDGEMNTCYNCLDVHVNEFGNRAHQPALVYDSPVTNTKTIFTYHELLEQVKTFAGVLQHEGGVQCGDRVVIYMPMIPQAIIAMLACARLGAVHCVVFGGFASDELATRILDCTPRVIVAASAGLLTAERVVPYKPLLDRALDIVQEQQQQQQQDVQKVEKVFIVQRSNVQTCDMQPGRDVDYDDAMKRCIQQENLVQEAVSLPSTHPHSILYTSGTTGRPKGVVRDTGGWVVALKYSMPTMYDAHPGDVFWAASDIGWVVGHAYIVVGPLLQGCTTILYEGKPVGTPDAGAFWRVIQDHGVKVLFAAPTAARAIKQVDPEGQLVKQYNVSSLQSFFLAGEHCDVDTLKWCETILQRRQNEDKENETLLPAVIDHWWQTELGWPGVGNFMGFQGKEKQQQKPAFVTKHGACAAPVPGYQLDIVRDNHDNDETSVVSVPANTLGNLVLKLPLPPGTLMTLYQNDEHCRKVYFDQYPGYYDSSDAAYRDEDGYIFIMGRTDDVINTAGHRLSTGTMEEILLQHDRVADCAVMGIRHDIKGQVPMGLVVLSKTNNNDDSDTDEIMILGELVEMVRTKLGPIANFQKVAIVKALPKTRSGKILRGTLAKIANGEAYTITPTIEDASVLDDLKPIIQNLVSE